MRFWDQKIRLNNEYRISKRCLIDLEKIIATTLQNLHCFKWILAHCMAAVAAAASIFAGINHCFQEILWQGMLLFIYFPKKLMRTHAMSIDQSKRFFEFSSMTFLYQDGVGLFQLLYIGKSYFHCKVCKKIAYLY